MNYALIFAGGIGSRMGLDIPKQFVEINSKPILVYTMQVFNDSPLIDKIVLVVPGDYLNYSRDLIAKYSLNKVIEVLPAGTTAIDSQFRGLSFLKNVCEDNDIVFIHDGVRPFINNDLLAECFNNVKKHGSAITVSPAFETISILGANNVIDKILPRQECMLARAPQVFKFKDIFNAHLKAKMNKKNYVDSASMLLDQGFKLSVVYGPWENIKITTQYDLKLCELWIGKDGK